ncbi:hypothetical protein RRSWK_00950 [Rhodopirellula sp. SWK7]|nr:hypothetical protein RRSWK_00950 [Rhodopirellula sp. SWK7]
MIKRLPYHEGADHLIDTVNDAIEAFDHFLEKYGAKDARVAST